MYRSQPEEHYAPQPPYHSQPPPPSPQTLQGSPHHSAHSPQFSPPCECYPPTQRETEELALYAQRKAMTKQLRQHFNKQYRRGATTSTAPPPPHGLGEMIIGIDIGTTTARMCALTTINSRLHHPVERGDVPEFSEMSYASVVYLHHPQDITTTTTPSSPYYNYNNPAFFPTTHPTTTPPTPPTTAFVGEAAIEKMDKYPQNVITSVKRFLGTPFDDAVVQRRVVQHRFRHDLQQDAEDGTCNIVLGDTTTTTALSSVTTTTTQATTITLADMTYNNTVHSPSVITSHIFRYLLSKAQYVTTQRITQAVVTIPVTYNHRQQAALLTAARLGGVDVVELLPEPAAVAISVAYDSDVLLRLHHSGHLIVYDLGGGVLTVTLLHFDVHTKQLSVVGYEESGQFGGDEFTNVLHDMVLQRFAEEHDIHDPFGYNNNMTNNNNNNNNNNHYHNNYNNPNNTITSLGNNPNVMQKKYIATCRAFYHRYFNLAKEQLLELYTTRYGHRYPIVIKFPAPLRTARVGGYDLRMVQITAMEYEAACRSLYLRCTNPIDRLLVAARIHPQDISKVLLTGSAAKTRGVRNAVARFFDGRVGVSCRSLHDNAVARGAAIYGAMLSTNTAQRIALDALTANSPTSCITGLPRAAKK